MRRRRKSNFDYYDELGIPEDATAEDIKKAYRRLSLKYHPDKYSNPNNLIGLNLVADVANNLSKFKRLAEAYEVLNDVDLKSQYDNNELPLVRKMGKPETDTNKKATSPFVDFIKDEHFSGKTPFTKYSK